MAQKKYSITQKVTIAGQTFSRTINYYGEPEDVTALVAKLAGIVTVKSEEVDLGNKKTNANETEVNYISSIVLGHDTLKPVYINTFDGKSMLFASNVDDKAIEAMVKTFKPFLGNATDNPVRSSIKFPAKPL